MQAKRIITLGVIIAIGLGLMPIGANAVSVPQAGTNLLTDSNFEQPFVQANSTAIVAPGWSPWWIPRPAGAPDWSYHQPNYDQSSTCSSTCDHRIHSGSNAQRMFQLFGTYVAGIYQQVSVPANVDVQFTIFGQGWSSTNDTPENVSVGGTDMQMRIGIDPWGGTNPLDPRVVWSNQVNALDSWYQFSVYAHSQNTTITVFTYAAPFDARRKNEVYWDDASLVVLSGDLAATAQATYPTATPEPIIYTPTPVSVALGTNLLIDGGFEGKLYIPCSKASDLPWRHISCENFDWDLRDANGQRVYIMWNTVQVPIGWTAWWYPPNTNHASADFYQNHPNNCYSDAAQSCIPWHNPEYRDTKGTAGIGPSRIHSGQNSQKYFTFWSVHEAGVMQTVNVPPGSTLRFSAYMQAWSSNNDGKDSDPSSYLSSGQTSMHMKVGIDPTGGDDPWSPAIVWSPEHDAYDAFGYYEVRAVAQSDKVTVYTHSMPEQIRKHNDVYVDDAELVAIDGGSASPAVAETTSGAPSAVVAAAPAPTALPRPDGAIVHNIQAGDTLYGLALQYNVPVDQLLKLNGLTMSSLLRIGDELVIAAAPTVVPTAAATSTTEPTSAATDQTPTPVQIAAASKTQLCVRAFNDLNGNGLFSNGEALIGGAVFVVADDQGKQVATYASDGVSDPHCFSRLTPGHYSVSIQPAPDTQATSDRRWSIVLDQGMTVDVNFGSRATGDAAPKPASSSEADSGAVVLILIVGAVGVAGWLIGRRR